MTMVNGFERDRSSGALLVQGLPQPIVPPETAFTDSFASGDARAWSSFRQDGVWEVQSWVAAEVPAPPSGSLNVIRFDQFDPTGVHIHSKLYETFNVVDGVDRVDDLGREDKLLPPGGESGTYSVWYYIRSYSALRDMGPTTIFQFKEDYSNDGRTFTGFGSDSQSILGLWNLADRKAWPDTLNPSYYDDVMRGQPADAPLLAVGLWHNPALRPRPGHQPQAVPAPIGRWFNVTVKLYRGDRVEYYVDGVLLDTWYNDEYPVGVRTRFPDGKLPMSWTLGIGCYGVNQGRLWASDVSFVRA